MLRERLKSIVSPTVLAVAMSLITPACAAIQQDTRAGIGAAAALEGKGDIEQMKFNNFNVSRVKFREFKSDGKDAEKCPGDILSDAKLPPTWPEETGGTFTFRFLEGEYPDCQPADGRDATTGQLVAVQLKKDMFTKVFELAKSIDGEPNGPTYFKFLAILTPAEGEQPWGGLLRNNWGSDGLFIYDPAIVQYLPQLDAMLSGYLAE